ncbi:xanthine dehydrogenase family protein subunit M [Rhodobacterales bacterium LSUCC0387]|nr:xanthine dehydrogenase family protein subunit M [Rhodobacterales bacterium LSUCC0374]MBF9039759.1 xanthine dehydrogenase family protein subunit M [Rhodobacterales bacterium LSUCC0387]
MKAPEFTYERPTEISEALAIIAQDAHEKAFLAGGQSLLPMMNFRLAAPKTLIDLGGLKDLKEIVAVEDGLRIGATVTYSELGASALVSEFSQVFDSVLPHIAHSAIRNRGTIGGSVALADPAAEMPAVLIALGASVELASQRGTRFVPADEFFHGLYLTERSDDELVLSVFIPNSSRSLSTGFYELARRHGDYAIAGVCISDDSRPSGSFNAPKVVLFGVSDRPLRAKSVEESLVGVARNDTRKIRSASEALSDLVFDSDLHNSQDTKQRLASVCVRRALEAM